MANNYYNYTTARLARNTLVTAEDINSVLADDSGSGSTFNSLPSPTAFTNGTQDDAAVSGTADAIVLTRSSPVTTSILIPGTKAYFKATGTNTGPTTVDLDSEGVTAVTTKAGVALSGGEIVSGGWYKVVYDGTQFQLVSEA